MYMVTNVMYYSIAIRLIQSLMHLRWYQCNSFGPPHPGSYRKAALPIECELF